MRHWGRYTYTFAASFASPADGWFWRAQARCRQWPKRPVKARLEELSVRLSFKYFQKGKVSRGWRHKSTGHRATQSSGGLTSRDELVSARSSPQTHKKSAKRKLRQHALVQAIYCVFAARFASVIRAARRRRWEAQGGRVVALGRFQEAVAGDIKPRTVMILVEWKSKAACDGYCNDPPCIRTGKRAPATTSGTSSTSSRTCRYS